MSIILLLKHSVCLNAAQLQKRQPFSTDQIRNFSKKFSVEVKAGIYLLNLCSSLTFRDSMYAGEVSSLLSLEGLTWSL
jgi:hypothetical protein